MTASTPHPTDLHVGARIRLRRRALGLTQEGLATLLGLTFQQVQKYERGVNRVSASKLQAIAEAMDISVCYFFEGLPGQPVGDGATVAQMSGDFLTLPDAHEFLEVLPKTAPQIRRHLLDLARSLIR